MFFSHEFSKLLHEERKRRKLGGFQEIEKTKQLFYVILKGSTSQENPVFLLNERGKGRGGVNYSISWLIGNVPFASP